MIISVKFMLGVFTMLFKEIVDNVITERECYHKNLTMYKVMLYSGELKFLRLKDSSQKKGNLLQILSIIFQSYEQKNLPHPLNKEIYF